MTRSATVRTLAGCSRTLAGRSSVVSLCIVSRRSTGCPSLRIVWTSMRTPAVTSMRAITTLLAPCSVPARLFVVPTLFGLGPDAEVGPPLHSRFVRTNASDAVPGHPRGQCSESAYEHALMETVKALKRSEFWGRVPHLFISGGFQTLSGCRRLVVNGGTHKTAEFHPHGLGSTAPHGNQSNASSSSSSSHLGFQRDHCPARGLAGLHAAPRRLLFSSPRVVVGHFELDYDAGQRDLEGLVGVHVPYVANCAHGVPLCAMAGKCEPSTEWASRWAQHPLASRPMDFHLRGTGFLLNPIRLAACAALQRVESGREFVCFEAGVETRQHGNDTSALFHIQGEGDVRIDLPPCDDTRPCANRKPGERALGGACPWRVPCRGAFSRDGYCPTRSCSQAAAWHPSTSTRARPRCSALWTRASARLRGGRTPCSNGYHCSRGTTTRI